MFSRIASRLQGFFTFGSDYKAQKRSSDSFGSNSSPSKRQRLEIKVDMKGGGQGEDDGLSRPSLSRVGQEGPPLCHGGSEPEMARPRHGLWKATENKSTGEKVNGYDFSNSSRTVSEETDFSFSRDGTTGHPQQPSESGDRLRRPSVRSPAGQTSPYNGNTRRPSEKDESIFKNWQGFHRSTQAPATTTTSPTVACLDRRQQQRLSNADSYLHRRVQPRDLAVKQCIRMDEKRKYKEMLSRYVSPGILETVDFSDDPPARPSDVITISDTESASGRRREGEGSSPIFLSSAEGSPSSRGGSVVDQRAYRSRNPTGRSDPKSRTESSGSYGLETGHWKALEKKMERVSSMLDELTRPSADRSVSLGRSRSGRSPMGEVIVIADEDGKDPIQTRSRTEASPRQEAIAIDDSSEEEVEVRKSRNSRDSTNDTSHEYAGANYARPGLRSLNDFEVSIKTSPFLRTNFLKNLLDKTEEKVRSLRVQETEAELREMRKMREEREAKCNEKIANLIRLTRRLPVPIEEPYIELEEEEEDDDVLIAEEATRDDRPELTDEQEQQVDRAFKCRNPDQVLVEGFRLQITARDIATLQGKNWLNDEVINFYFNMIVDRSERNKKLPSVYAFNTFFYPKVIGGGQKAVRRWTKTVDIFLHSYVILPVHLGMHWCLAVIDFPKKEIRYYDSMGGSNNACLDALLRYLVDEMQDKKQQAFDTKGWQTINVKDIPQQMNGSDCGMFSCKFADYITRNASITFNQSHMPYFRRRMVYEILTKQLM